MNVSSNSTIGVYYLTNISDLSFNNIEMIEGLDKLKKLQDLTLYNNRISCIENMDQLTNLHVFSIGNNRLTDLENVCRSMHSVMQYADLFGELQT